MCFFPSFSTQKKRPPKRSLSHRGRFRLVPSSLNYDLPENKSVPFFPYLPENKSVPFFPPSLRTSTTLTAWGRLERRVRPMFDTRFGPSFSLVAHIFLCSLLYPFFRIGNIAAGRFDWGRRICASLRRAPFCNQGFRLRLGPLPLTYDLLENKSAPFSFVWSPKEKTAEAVFSHQGFRLRLDPLPLTYDLLENKSVPFLFQIQAWSVILNLRSPGK